jgi:hypothetical protein
MCLTPHNSALYISNGSRFLSGCVFCAKDEIAQRATAMAAECLQLTVTRNVGDDAPDFT